MDGAPSLLVPPGRRGRSDDGTAFMPDPEGGPARIDDTLAENLAEEFLESATRGEDAVEDSLDAIVPEELGGPFVETSAAVEFALDIDGANPEDAEPEPLPRPVAGLVQPALEAILEAAPDGAESAEAGAIDMGDTGAVEPVTLGPESYRAAAAEAPPPEEPQPASRSRRKRR